MANIEHPDQIFTVPQFNEWAKSNDVPIDIKAVENKVQATNGLYSAPVFDIYEKGELMAANCTSEAYAVNYAVDRVKNIRETKKYCVDWRE